MKIEPLVIGDLVAKIPVIQGGMGVGVSLSNLAGAVALEGGIGVISTAQIGYREPDFDLHPIEANLRAIGDEIRKAKEKAKGGIIGVNIMVATHRHQRIGLRRKNSRFQYILHIRKIGCSINNIAQMYGHRAKRVGMVGAHEILPACTCLVDVRVSAYVHTIVVAQGMDSSIACLLIVLHRLLKSLINRRG